MTKAMQILYNHNCCQKICYGFFHYVLQRGQTVALHHCFEVFKNISITSHLVQYFTQNPSCSLRTQCVYLRRPRYPPRGKSRAKGKLITSVVDVCILQLTVDPPSCCLHKDAFSSSFKSILRAGDFNIENTRVRRSDDSGVVDDVAPDASSPSSTVSSASSSSNLLTEPAKPTITVDVNLDEASGDKPVAEEGRKLGDVTVASKCVVNSSLLSTPLNVVDICAPVSTPTTQVGTPGGAQLQLTKNVVVVVKSSNSAVVEKGDQSAALLDQNNHVEQTKKVSLQTVTVTAAPTPIHVSPVCDDNARPSKQRDNSVAESSSKRCQQSVAGDRKTIQKTNLCRIDSSPCSCTAASASTAASSAANGNSAPFSSPNAGRVAKVTARSQLAVTKITTASSTPVTSSPQHFPPVTSKPCNGTSASGQTAQLAVRAIEQGDRVLSSCVSDKPAARQRHRSMPGEQCPTKKLSCGSDAAKQTVMSTENSNADKPNEEKTKPKTDLNEVERASEITLSSRAHVQPNCSSSIKRIVPSTPTDDVSTSVVIGRLKKISPRDSPVTSSCLASGKLRRRTTVLGLASRVPPSAPQADECAGPVICDAFESLRRQQEQEAVAAAARLAQNTKDAPAAVASGVAKSRQRSARTKSGRASVVSVTAKSKLSSSRQTSAAVARNRKPKTPTTSAVNSSFGISSKTPRNRKDRKDRGRRTQRSRSRSLRRSVSSAHTEESDTGTDVTEAASDVALNSASERDDVARLRAVTKRRYQPIKTYKIEQTKAIEPSPNVRRCRMSKARDGSFEMSSVHPGQLRDPAGSAKDASFGDEVSATKAKPTDAGKQKRSTSSNNTEHRGSCVDQVTGTTNMVCKDAGGVCSRLSSRRESHSAAPMCGGDDSNVMNVDEVNINTPHAPETQCAKLPMSSFKFGEKHEAERSMATGDSRPARRSSRRSRPLHCAADVEHVHADRSNDDRADRDVDQPARKPPIASMTSRVDGAVIQADFAAEDVDKDEDVDRSPRFVRKRDSLVTTGGSVDSRRSSVEKAQTGFNTLDRDATLSWHNNSFFDNNITSNDMASVSQLVIPNSDFILCTINCYCDLCWHQSRRKPSELALFNSLCFHLTVAVLSL